ncbi:MAG: AAA family ATPase [Prevotellaceae bacterium]|jgi:AAA15 family ATPase/GTPase|nr:AAA family ATPase [Prevotellaceae bacterium]
MINIEHLTIGNFRGFDSLEIDGFSKVNLFVGKNNSGKTSILESLFLLTGMSNPMSPVTINSIRGLNVESAKQLIYLFHNLRTENKPFFHAVFGDASERSLELEANYKQSASAYMPEIAGIDLNFSVKKTHGEKVFDRCLMTFEDNIIRQEVSRNYREDLYAAFVFPDKDDAGALTKYSEIIKKKEHDFVLDSLQAFDGNIRNIHPLPDGIYFDIDGIDELVPSSIMGDGIRRFLNIVTAVSAKRNAFVLIDEIENGLHYSAYKLLWQSLMSFSEKYDVQLFITTHNIETLSCLKSILEQQEYATMREYTKVFAVSKTLKAGYKTYRYSYEGFSDAIEHETEIRN